MLTDIVSGVFSAIGKPVSTVIDGWQARKTAAAEVSNKVRELDAEARLAAVRAKLERAQRGQQIDADWDSKAQDDMKTSWKDEFLLILLFSPVLGIFIAPYLPASISAGVQDRILQAVQILDKFPMWYIIILLGIVAAVYGLRWLIAPIARRLSK